MKKLMLKLGVMALLGTMMSAASVDQVLKNAREDYYKGVEVKKVKHVKEAKNVLVILDDDHTCDHVYKELLAYSKYVSLNSYLLVEDSNINGHPVYPEFGPGPFEAIEKFLPQQHSFIIDKSKEKFYLTFNPNGYLKKIKE